MSKFFSLCKTNNKKHGLKDQQMEFKTNKKHPGSFCYGISVFLVCMIFLLSCFYIFNITSSATHGFKVSDYGDIINELKLANQDLKDKVNDFENLDYIKTKSVELGLVPVSDVDYLEVASKGVALK